MKSSNKTMSLKKSLRRLVKWLLPLAAFLAVYGLARLDAPLYSQPIAQAVAVQTGKGQKHVDTYQNTDRLWHQQITAKYLNGKRRGQKFHFGNTYSFSGAQDSRVSVGSQFFVSDNHGHYSVNTFKRDAVVLGLFALTLTLLAIVMKKRLLLTLGSIAVNTVIFIWACHVDFSAHQVLAWWLFVGVGILFTVITTLFIVGVKPIAAVVSGATILATGMAVALGYLVFNITGYNSLHLETVKYVTQAPQLLFFVQIIIGSLGAVLDECNDISVAVFQLPNGAKRRYQAGMAIGRNVMGPLIAVLFMIFIAETFSEAILWIRNGNAITYTVSWTMGLGFAQSLVSAFGIVLAVPLTAFLSAILAKKVAVK